jgi:hypothetical protein
VDTKPNNFTLIYFNVDPCGSGSGKPTIEVNVYAGVAKPFQNIQQSLPSASTNLSQVAMDSRLQGRFRASNLREIKQLMTYRTNCHYNKIVIPVNGHNFENSILGKQ